MKPKAPKIEVLGCKAIEVYYIDSDNRVCIIGENFDPIEYLDTKLFIELNNKWITQYETKST